MEIASLPKQQVTQQTRSAYSRYVYAIQSDETMVQYRRHFKQFLRYVGISDTDLEQGVNMLYEQIQKDKEWFMESLLNYTADQKLRVTKKEISSSTLRNLHKPIKLFCDMNDILLNWRLIKRGLPPGKRSANDRTPTIDEIHKLMEFGDIRIKPIVLVMISSGIRLGAWHYLKWKHVTPIHNASNNNNNNNNRVIAAKLLVYAGEPEQYFTFMTSEAYVALKEWMNFRESYGEKITGESWLMRDIWRTMSMPYGAKWGLAKFPKKLSHKSIRVMINRALYKQNIRPSLLEEGNRCHEFKAVHGFRKYFKTVCESGGMKPANVELLIGHDIGISSSYYKPTESQLLEDYLKAADALTISNEYRLQKQVDYYKERSDKLESMSQQIEAIKGRLGL